MRDSVSLQEQCRERELVSPTDLMKLPDLAGYLRLGRGLPLAKFENCFVNYPKVAEAFVERQVVVRQAEELKEPIALEGKNDFSAHSTKRVKTPFI